jgi:PAS domain S-box-containing protein
MTVWPKAYRVAKRSAVLILAGGLAFAISLLLLKDAQQDRLRTTELLVAVERAQLIRQVATTAQDLTSARKNRSDVRKKLKAIADQLADSAIAGTRGSTADQQLRAFVARLRSLSLGGNQRVAANDPKLVGVVSAGSGSLAANFDQQVTGILAAQVRERSLRRNFIVLFVVLALVILATVLLHRTRHSGSPVPVMQTPSNTVERRLMDSLAGLTEGVALFGANDDLIFTTPRFGEIYQGIFDPLPGTSFEVFAHAISFARSGADNAVSEDDTHSRLAERLARHHSPHGPSKEYLKDGRCLEVAEYATSEGGTIILVRDITESERREAVRVLDDERTRAIVETVFDGIIMINDEGIVETFNPAAEAIFGYNGTEVIDQNVAMLMPADYAGAHDGYIERYLGGGEANVIGQIRELEGQRSDGTVFPLEIAVNEVNATWILQERRQRPRRVFIATLRDITRQKEMSRQLQQSQKMEAIGTLAGGIAHDFNNILSIILGYTGLTLEEEGLGDDAEENLGMILQAGTRARDLVDQILTFSRRGEQERLQVDVQTILEDGLKLLRSSLPSTVDIRKEIGDGPFEVMANPTQMHQVLMNLCTNAGQAMESGGILEVKLETQDPTGAETERQVQIMVRDTGVGMDSDTLERVFEPFYTTKAPGSGTGLGLSVVHGIVSDHGGSITVTSAPGAGTTFIVRLPASTEGSPHVAPDLSVAPSGQGRILFVDDEPAVTRMGEKLLGRLGYTVETETSSPEALRRFRAAPDEFDLVVTDQTMPEMTGEVLAQELRRIRGDIPVIVCTGFSKTFTRERARELGIDGYVMKPSLATDLGQVVHDVLRERDR